MKIFKRILKILAILIGVVVLAAAAMIGYLSITEYKPAAEEQVSVVQSGEGEKLSALDKSEFTVLTWNVGYCALGKESDFFMDGGDDVRPDSKSIVTKNYAGILQAIRNIDPDFLMLQEVDSDSHRSYNLDEVAGLRRDLGADGAAASAYALNYKCNFVPYPLPKTLGKVNSGLLTISDYAVTEAERVSLPCPFSWPMRVANLKRCLLVERIPIEGSDKELVLVNLHLEAYDDGQGKTAQTRQLRTLLDAEYRKGNYVIAGGDWNQIFPETDNTYPVLLTNWIPGALDRADLGKWNYAYDDSVPTCRLLNQPYDPADSAHTQYYVIDGFMVSPNLTVKSVRTQDEQFAFSDHNPVLLTVEFGA